MSEVNFAKGVKVETIKTQYGEIIKLSVNYKQFGENPISDKGYIYFDIKTSKSGNKYTDINNFKKDENIPY